MPKKFVTKPETIEALQFTGTVESARDISKWVKGVVGDRYFSTRMREGTEKWGFAQDTPDLVDQSKTLHVETKDWDRYLNTGDWLVCFSGDKWEINTSERMTAKYDEVKDDSSADV